MSNQKKIVIYPFSKVYKGDVISYDDDLVNNRRVIVSDKHDGAINYIKHGEGIFTKRSSFYYKGDFRNDVRSGKGSIVYENNSRYSGDWVNDRQSGKGEITWADGTVYTGEVKSNEANPTTELAIAHGRGVLTFPENTKYKGIFSNNRHISGERFYNNTNDVFKGTLHDDMNNFYKKGNLNVFNYYIYDGNFASKKFNGKGTITYINGDTYSGVFKNGFFNGTGIFYDSVNKREYRGNWKNGNMLTNHTIRYSDMSRKGNSLSKPKKININQLRIEADKNPASNIFRPAPNTLFRKEGYILDYSYNIPDVLFLFKKLKRTNPHEYKDKPVAYYTIRAHGGYSHGETKKFIEKDIRALEYDIQDHKKEAVLWETEINKEYIQRLEKELKLLKKRYDRLTGDNPYEGEQDTFIVPEGIRLVFLSKSLTTLPSSTDKFLFKPEFYTNSLTDRNSYQSISPITIFSAIKNNPSGSVSKIDICKFLNNKTLPSKFTTNYMNWRISRRDNTRENSDFFRYSGAHPYDEIGSLLRNCSNSIYDSGMECSNLTLTWAPVIGSKAEDKRRVKVGIYPLPSESLNKEAQNPKIKVSGMEYAFESFKHHKSFADGFMPSDPSMTNDDYMIGNVEYITDAWKMWNIYGDKSSELKDFVQLLPRGTREHPCVYFMNTCRSVMSDSSARNVDRDVGRSLRTLSDTVQGSYNQI